ncbi:hypothetical protein COOONC_21702 [Cooperia oncophora]
MGHEEAVGGEKSHEAHTIDRVKASWIPQGTVSVQRRDRIPDANSETSIRMVIACMGCYGRQAKNMVDRYTIGTTGYGGHIWRQVQNCEASFSRL